MRPPYPERRPYTDMAPATWERIARLSLGMRDRVIERAAILIHDAGLTPAEADERALAEEAGVHAQQTIGGV